MKFHVDPLEKKYIWAVMAFTLLAFAVQVYYAAAHNAHPPSNVETVDSSRLHLAEGVGGGEFMEKNLGLKRDENGELVLTMVAARYGFYPQEVTVPVDEPIRLRIATIDVLHGLHVPYSDFNTMVVPGYVSDMTSTFKRTGEFPLICNEYCGVGHAYMYSRFNVVPQDEFKL